VTDGHGEQPAGDESGDEDGRVVERRHGVVGREPLRRIVVTLQEPQNRGIALDAGPRASRRERARNPRVAVAAFNAKNVVMVLTGLRRGDPLNAVMIPEMGELEHLSVGFVSLTEALPLTTPAGRATAAMLAVFSEFEQEVLRWHVIIATERFRE
jgi:hypothetical protein